MDMNKYFLSILTISILICFSCPANLDQTGNENSPGTLFFSEYIEGSGWNKAIEIYNGYAENINLAACEIRLYFNGNPASSANIIFDEVELPPGEVYVIAYSSFPYPEYCDLMHGNVRFNGNDALELLFNNEPMDIIGQIGYDPGMEWESDDITTMDRTLRKKCSIRQGDTNGYDSFDPGLEWEGFPADTFSGLGEHCQ